MPQENERVNGEIREFAPGLHLHEAWVRFLGVPLKTRMTVVELGNNKLWLHSPIGNPDTLATRLASLGEVSHLIAPNPLHNLGVVSFASAFPGASVLVCPGVEKRCPGLGPHGLLGKNAEVEWADVLDQCLIGATGGFQEAVFLHRSSGTLLVTDFIEIIDESCAAAWGRALLPLFGQGSKPSASPEHRWLNDDADALEASIEKIRDWDFERVILAHGPLVEEGGKALFEKVADMLIATLRSRGPVRRALFRALG